MSAEIEIENGFPFIANSLRATVQHHYINGLEGCYRSKLGHVQKNLLPLIYNYLPKLLHPV